MSMMPDMTAPRGWRCPCCNRVYSPTTPMCFTCGGTTNPPPQPDTTGKPLGACAMCHGSGFGVGGWPCGCRRVTMFTDKISTGTGAY